MRKIEKDNENPLDDYLIEISDNISPYFYKFNYTANDITTLSLISGLICIYLLFNEYYLLSGIFYFIGYFFDCMDGNYARKYNQVSKFGDMYDHFKDITVFLLVMYAIYTKVRHPITVFSIITILSILSLIHIGCQEKIYQKNESKTLEFTKELCKDEKMIKITKYFGCGTMNLAVALIIAFGL